MVQSFLFEIISRKIIMDIMGSHLRKMCTKDVNACINYIWKMHDNSDILGIFHLSKYCEEIKWKINRCY